MLLIMVTGDRPGSLLQLVTQSNLRSKFLHLPVVLLIYGIVSKASSTDIQYYQLLHTVPKVLPCLTIPCSKGQVPVNVHHS